MIRRPSITFSSRSWVRKNWRILLRARRVETRSIQSRLGPADDDEVKMSTMSPFLIS